MNYLIGNSVNVLNLEGMKCPKPLYELQKYLQLDTTKGVFKVLCTDRNAIDDFSSFEEFGVIKICSTSFQDEKIIFEIQKLED
jgi:TusA-related sulfurtransferase